MEPSLNNLRVAMLSVHASPLARLGSEKAGGMNVYIRDLSAELDKRGVTIDIFTRKTKADQPDIVKNGLCRIITIPAGPVRSLSTAETFLHLEEFTYNLNAFAESESTNYDILHSHYWLSGIVAEKLKTLWNTPYIHMFHTLGHMKNRIATTPEEKEPEFRLAGEYTIIETSDKLISATPAERIQLMWLYGANPKKIKVIPPGVDLKRFSPVPQLEARNQIGIDEKIPLLVFAGRIEPLKGLDTLLAAIHLLRKQSDDDFVLTIVGGSQSQDELEGEMKRLQDLRDDLGLTEVVNFIGPRDQDSLRYFYSAADVAIMPSYYESFGLFALEAMACGTPVIASEVGGLAYLIRDGETGFHVPYREPEALAQKIELLLTDKPLRAQMSHQASENAKSYSWEIITDQIVATYEELLKQ